MLNLLGDRGTKRDERERFVESLRRSEEIFRRLVEGVTDYAIFMLDPEGHVATWNTGAERIKGYSAGEIIGQHFSVFYPPEALLRGWPARELDEATARGRFEDEGWRVRKDGSLFWANVVITTVYDQQGTLCGFSKVTRDLSERRQREEDLRRSRDLVEERVAQRTAELTEANEALRREVAERHAAEHALSESEIRQRELMEILPVGVYTCDAPSGVIRYYNPRAAELWGREPSVGECFCGSLRLHRPDGTPLRHEDTPMAQVLRDGVSVRDRTVMIERPDGTRITVRVNIEPIRRDDGRLVGAINVLQDVTEHERLLEDVRLSEERFRQLVVGLPAAVYTTDRDGRIVLYNDQAAELWGRHPQLGQDLWCGSLRLFRGDGTPLPHDECPMAVSLLEGRPIRGEEIVVERPDGERRWILPHPQPLRDAAGTITGAVNMLVDITDRKQAEEELRVLGRQLQEKVEALAEADHRKNEFLATLAHELRNPLAPIRYSLELLERADDDPKIRREARGTMERQLRQMVRLVDDLLDVSRLSNNKLRLMKEPLELGPVLDSALETARPFIEGAGHQLVVERPSEPVHVHGDSTRLAQVFGNLLHNAAKFTPEGGRVSVAVEPGRGEVVVRVGDTGVGIAARHLPRLFEMFSQATPSLERSEEGLGIGLALVRALVELHGGSVEARSAGPGQGSEFVVRLPTCEPLAAHTTGATVATVAHEPFVIAPKRRVLIADDNPDSVDALGALLELDGHEVAIAHDGHEALELAAGFLPEVVLLDIGMPGLNGYDTARRMREASWSNGLVLVAITGWGQEADKQQAREAGFDFHLTKPVDAADLESLLASVPPRERPSGPD